MMINTLFSIYRVPRSVASRITHALTPRGTPREGYRNASRIDDCCQLLLHSLTFPSFLFSPHSFPPLFRVIPCPHSLPMRSRPATATLQGYDFVRDIRNHSEKARIARAAPRKRERKRDREKEEPRERQRDGENTQRKVEKESALIKPT